MIVAIDGPAGAGKSTTARAVAQALGYDYVDTGAMYRAVALAAEERGLSLPEDAEAIIDLAAKLPMYFDHGGARVFVDGHDVSSEIRTARIGSLASRVAVLPGVRCVAVERQREMGRQAEASTGGAVLEGRDIQTVVFPDAQVKIFLTASTSTRAQRRLEQWNLGGQEAAIEEAERDVVERDERDSKREASPLQAAPDAVHIATDGLTPAEVVEAIVQLVRERQT